MRRCKFKQAEPFQKMLGMSEGSESICCSQVPSRGKLRGFLMMCKQDQVSFIQFIQSLANDALGIDPVEGLCKAGEALIVFLTCECGWC